MKQIGIYIICALMGYLVGCLNPAYIFAKARGYDIRTRGSGNAGASNAMLLMGKKRGVFIALFDIFKAFISCEAARILLPAMALAGTVAGVGCIFGHMFPATIGFRGGKGLACFGGVALALNWKLFIMTFLLITVVALVSDYIVCSMATGVTIYPLCLGIFAGMWNSVFVMLFASVVMLLKHKENYRRIRNGLEFRISYLWKKDEYEKYKERARLAGIRGEDGQ